MTSLRRHPRHPAAPSVLACAVGLALLASPGAHAQTPSSNVRLIGSGASRVVLEVEVPAPTLTPLEKEPSVVRLAVEGFGLDGRVGMPALPVRVVTVAVPPTGEVRLEAAGLETEIREGVLLAPVPDVDPGDPERSPRYGRSEAAYAQKDGQGSVRARLLGVSWLRNQRVARIAVLPAEYDAPARRLTFARRVRLEVQVAATGPLGAPAEPRDPFERVYRDVVVNYEQGKAWRRPATRSLFGREGARPTGATAVADVVPTTSIFAGRSWVKIAIEKTGFYKVGFDQLRNLELFSQEVTTPLDSLRLFNWPGVPVLPSNSYCDSCDYREVSISLADDGDGLFNRNEDYFYFFAMGPSDWASLYDPAQPETTFLDHPYETRNYYYLTRATATSPVPGTPKRIVNRDGSALGGEIEPATFLSRAHFEQDNEYWPDASPFVDSRNASLFWEKWFWRSRTQNQSFVQTFETPGIDSTQPARVRIRTWGLSTNISPQLGYRRTIPDHFLNLSLNDANVVFPERSWNGFLVQQYDTTVVGPALRSQNQFVMSIPNRIDPQNPLRVDRTGFAWADYFYQRRFEPVADELAFDSPAGGGTFLYRIGPFTSLPEVFDVTIASEPVRITFPGAQYVPVPGGFQVSFRASDTGLHRYRVVAGTRIVKPPTSTIIDAPATSLDNLRSPTESADYILVYYDGFKQAADELLDWRKDHLPLPGNAGPYAVRGVPISALYDQFSGGRTDPAAIRNFLRAAYFNWNNGTRRPTFVSFLGDASYDFKNLTGRAPAGQPGTLVPSYENGFDQLPQRQYASDDWMLNVDDPREILPDFYGGRVPVGDAATALDVVRNKIVRYEQVVPLGEYRDQVMFVADDNEQGSAPDGIGWGHLSQTTQIDSSYTPLEIDRGYVYLHTYADGPGDTKPGAKADIKKHINEGVAMFNYIGHGSPFKIADESVFLDTDVGTLVNAPRFTVFVAASCDVGKYNDPTVQSLGERLITRPGGGAIGVISATELAYSFQNFALNRTLYRNIFRRDSVDCQFHVTLAEALLAAKFGDVNGQKYQLMGDAAARVNLPKLWTELTLLPDTGSTPLTEIRRGQTVRFRGRVLDCPGGTPVGLTGVAKLLIEDSAPLLEVPDCDPNAYCTQYYYKAGAMYRGDVSIANGAFEGRFVVPLEARQGPRGRVRGYVQGQSAGFAVGIDGVGAIATQVSAGSGVSDDNEGPRVTLSFTGGSTSVRPDAELRVDLFDPSGILTTGHTPQNGIVVTIDGNTTSRVDITSSFRYAAESYQSGTATFRLPGLSPGPHRIEVSAADNLASGLGAGAHRTNATLDFIVVNSPPLSIDRAYLFPNPSHSGGAGSGGAFVVDAPGDSVNVLLRLYTASGRLIRTLKAFGGIGQVQIAWDGLDDEGAELANGVYFFTVHVNARDADGASSARQRADAQGRFVILNRR